MRRKYYGEKATFNHNGTVTVAHRSQSHHQQAKRPSPKLRHSVWTGQQVRWSAGCSSSSRMRTGPLPGRLRCTRRPALTRRHCIGGSSITPSSTLSRGCCSQRLLSWRTVKTHKWCVSKESVPLCWCVGEMLQIGASRWKSPWGISLSGSASQQSHVHPYFQIVSLEGIQG